jgi:DNA invertase Pin-like site-specific DNA recombinase
VSVYRDVASGKSTNGRHQLQRALTDLGARRADALVVAKLDRLSRSTVDFGRVLTLAKRHSWPLVIIDLNIDTSTLTGKLIADVLISVAEWERGAIAERTKAAMAVAKKRRAADGKPPFGRPKSIDAKVEQRIVRMRKGGDSFQTIADRLNSDASKPPMGKRWAWQTISRVVRRHVDEPIRRRVRSARLD